MASSKIKKDSLEDYCLQENLSIEKGYYTHAGKYVVRGIHIESSVLALGNEKLDLERAILQAELHLLEKMIARKALVTVEAKYKREHQKFGNKEFITFEIKGKTIGPYSSG